MSYSLSYTESSTFTITENRILGRLIELLPDAIDLYDDVLWEARRAGPEKEKLVRRLGRGRVEPLLEDAIARFQSTGSFDNVEGAGVPRTLFDLIEAKLLRTQEELTGAAARRCRVGRKSDE
jgi:hypothetical protein